MPHRMVHVGVSALIALTVVSADVAHASAPRAEPGPPGNAALIGEIETATGGTAQIAYHAETGRVRFIGMSGDQPIARVAGVAGTAPPEAIARGFLDRY